MTLTSGSQSFAKRLLVRALIWPAFGTLFLFVVLVALGIWQLKRLEWKNELLLAIDQAETRPAVNLQAEPRPFEKVIVSGRWLPPLAHYGVEVRDTRYGPRMGSQVVAALARPNSPAVLVLLGWMADGAPFTLPAGEAHVVGYVRAQEHPGWLSAGDSPKTARFFTLDAVEIGKILSVSVEPYTVVALQTQDIKDSMSDLGPVPASQLPRPTNNHLSYAATWFGLSATLLAVFGVWVRGYLAM